MARCKANTKYVNFPLRAGSGRLIQQEQADGERISLGLGALISGEAKRGGHFSKGKFDKLLLRHREIRGFFCGGSGGGGGGSGGWYLADCYSDDNRCLRVGEKV